MLWSCEDYWIGLLLIIIGLWSYSLCVISLTVVCLESGYHEFNYVSCAEGFNLNQNSVPEPHRVQSPATLVCTGFTWNMFFPYWCLVGPNDAATGRSFLPDLKKKRVRMRTGCNLLPLLSPETLVDHRTISSCQGFARGSDIMEKGLINYHCRSF